MDNNNNNPNAALVVNLQCKIRSLENKTEIYRKEIAILEGKIKVYEDDSCIKANKINEQLEHIAILEKDNMQLVNKLNEITSLMQTEKNVMLSTATSQREGYTNEIQNMKAVIESLKKENEKITNELIQKTNENDLYNQDNSILLTKVKEYEESHMNNFYESNYKAEQLSEKFDNQINEYTTTILKEIKLLAQYIETYFVFEDHDIQAPNLFTISHFPTDSFVNFDLLKSAIVNARAKAAASCRQYQQKVYQVQKENDNLHKILEGKLYEISNLKKVLSEIKEENCNLANENQKLKLTFTQQKQSEKRMSLSFSELEKNNNKYFDNVAEVIKMELEKILNDELLKHYNVIILNSTNDYSLANNSKFKFEDALDKLITVNNALIDDVKTFMQNNDTLSNIKDNYMVEDVSELNEKIAKLNEEVINYEKVLGLAQNERNLLLSQIEILEKNQNHNLSKPEEKEINNNNQ